MNGRMLDEFLNQTLFFGLDDARNKHAEWVALQRRAPTLFVEIPNTGAYAAAFTATGDRLRNPDQLR